MRMTQAEQIIGMFNGITPLAKALGHKHPTTVQGWKKRGFIPSAQHEPVIEAGRKVGILVRPDDFFFSASTGSQ